MDGRHPEQPPQRTAQPISSADSGERSVAARRSWAAPGLSRGCTAAIYIVFWPNLEIPHQSTGGVFGGSIVLHMHRISSDLSGEAEKRSNCEMCSNIMHE